MPYHTNEELLAHLHAFASRAGGRASVRVVGQTREAREIHALTVAAPGREPDPSRPQALVTANIHGNEVISSEVAHHIAELLTSPSLDDPAQALLQVADVTVLPAINLDSRAPAAAALAAGHVRGRSARGNAAGVDLNRNFPWVEGAADVWYPWSGTDRPWLPWYRGAEPLSEPECQAVRGLAEALRPRAAINLHSVGELFLYPWCFKAEEPPDLRAYLSMAAAFVSAQPIDSYDVKQSRSWYAVLGDLDDWLYEAYGTLSVTVELARPLCGVGWNPLRLATSLAWMNPPDPEPTLVAATAAVLDGLAEGVRQRSGS